MDFYGELGDTFAVPLKPHNRCGGFKPLREKWFLHLETICAGCCWSMGRRNATVTLHLPVLDAAAVMLYNFLCELADRCDTQYGEQFCHFYALQQRANAVHFGQHSRHRAVLITPSAVPSSTIPASFAGVALSPYPANDHRQARTSRHQIT